MNRERTLFDGMKLRAAIKPWLRALEVYDVERAALEEQMKELARELPVWPPFTDPGLARRKDPPSSHDAADRVVRSGVRKANALTILEALRKAGRRRST